jgi:O-antigen/teichoic acid export membrane protein
LVAPRRSPSPGSSAQLGFYAIGVTVVQLANVLSQFGMDNGVMVRYVAHYRAEADHARVRGTVLLVLGVAFALSVALSVLLFAGAGLLAEGVFGKPFLESAFRAFSLAVPFFTLMSTALFATQGFQTVKYATYVEHVLRPLVNLGLAVGFICSGRRYSGL